MNVNSIMLGLADVTGLEVEEDSYTGNASEYIIFNYADERGELFGNDTMLTETASMIINITLIKYKRDSDETDYQSIKKAVRDYLLSNDAYDVSSSVYTEKLSDYDEARHLVFECKFTKEVEKE